MPVDVQRDIPGLFVAAVRSWLTSPPKQKTRLSAYLQPWLPVALMQHWRGGSFIQTNLKELHLHIDGVAFMPVFERHKRIGSSYIAPLLAVLQETSLETFRIIINPDAAVWRMEYRNHAATSTPSPGG